MTDLRRWNFNSNIFVSLAAEPLRAARCSIEKVLLAVTCWRHLENVLRFDGHLVGLRRDYRVRFLLLKDHGLVLLLHELLLL